MWRCGLVVDTWFWDQKVPGSSPALCQVDVEPLWKAFYMHFLTPLMCKTSTRLEAVSYSDASFVMTAPLWCSPGSWERYNGWNGLSGTRCKALRALFMDKRYINALFNFVILILNFSLSVPSREAGYSQVYYQTKIDFLILFFFRLTFFSLKSG